MDKAARKLEPSEKRKIHIRNMDISIFFYTQKFKDLKKEIKGQILNVAL